MDQLSQHGSAVMADLSRRYGLSQDAVRAMMDAVSRGGGTMAQFSVPELGGMGQWSSGGMTMVGDMFNSNLQALVSNLCGEISAAWFNGSFYLPPPAPSSGGQWQGQGTGQGGVSMSFGGGGSWWPPELGSPSSSGSQNNLSYAIFPDRGRLAVNLGGQVTVYDTLDHQIGGVGQQQSGDASWTFTSQYGTVYLNQLPVVSGQGQAAQAPSWQSAPEAGQPAPQTAPEPAPAADPAAAQPVQGDVFAALEKLGQLRDMGVLTEAEFQAKKAELLARL
ncbi:SHOCT domain-containing protein [Mangrovicoccus algicola]|uniref:SHOCT domain-containing protein n=1 Tax=Mangrovicoccus algicola TaxID=2771008 RepID=A0A8J7CWK8_9RHOB|nr:SHOCT domain-containing protein [Mangrovicoccus algicola]MBE3637887.1 SHOCT domain-containing protein [Mangrovicoccus algicola]